MSAGAGSWRRVMMPEASESRQAEGGAPKSLLLRHYLESKTLVALRLDAELYGLTRTGTKKQVVERLLAEDALLSAPAIPPGEMRSCCPQKRAPR